MSLNQTLTSAERAQIITLLAPLNPSFVYLFGSAARGELRAESDVDIAFYSLEPVDRLAVFKMSESLAAALNRDVDLIDLSISNDVIRVEVIGTGELLSAPDVQVLYERQMRWLKQYAMLNRERRPIIERIKREGKIYG